MSELYAIRRKGRASGLWSNTTLLSTPHSGELNFRHDEPFTLDYLFYPTASPQSKSHFVKGGLTFGCNANGRFSFALSPLNGNGANEGITWTTGIFGNTLNRWYHITVTKDAGFGSVSNYKLFVNGVEQTSIFSSSFGLLPESDITDTNDLRVGSPNPANNMTGYLAAYRVYKSAFNLAKHQKSYKEEGALAVDENLKLEYTFNGGEIQNFIDGSGFNHTGIRSGFNAAVNVDAYSLSVESTSSPSNIISVNQLIAGKI